MSRPRVVSADEWQAAREELLAKEKAHTRALDALAAERRRMPMARLNKDYRFVAPDRTEAGLTDLFQGRRQLVIYHHMLEPGQDWICGGCGTFTDNIPEHVHEHLNARDTTLILMSRAPQDEIDVVGKRMGWATLWDWSHGYGFNDEMSVEADFGLSVLVLGG